MSPTVRIIQMLLATVVAISLASLSPALAIENSQPACCCQSNDTCKEHSPQSSCACAGCPVTLHAQPLAIFSEKNRALSLPSSDQRWNPKDERADERRAAPAVPPPRIPA
ncbi:MAG: hypothetical protein ACKOAS_09300 [Verrucomicrobiota bacterium]